jgi:hypothetical protein
MSKKTKEKVEPYNLWSDETAPGEVFEHAAFLKRLKEVHGIDPATTKGQRSTRMHMDGDTWFSYEWEWTIGGKKFHQSTRQLRRGMDREIWAHGG